jgi:hypothetical protein
MGYPHRVNVRGHRLVEVIEVICSGVKYLSKNTLKYYISHFFGVYVLYLTIYIFDNFYFYSTTFLKKNNVLFTPYIFPDNQKYLSYFECLAGQENCLIDTLIKRTSLVIPTASDQADSLNTNASFVNHV